MSGARYGIENKRAGTICRNGVAEFHWEYDHVGPFRLALNGEVRWRGYSEIHAYSLYGDHPRGRGFYLSCSVENATVHSARTASKTLLATSRSVRGYFLFTIDGAVNLVISFILQEMPAPVIWGSTSRQPQSGLR